MSLDRTDSGDESENVSPVHIYSGSLIVSTQHNKCWRGKPKMIQKFCVLISGASEYNPGITGKPLLNDYHSGNPSWEKLTVMTPVVVKTMTPLIPFYFTMSPNSVLSYCIV